MQWHINRNHNFTDNWVKLNSTKLTYEKCKMPNNMTILSPNIASPENPNFILHEYMVLTLEQVPPSK
jgi:hypothetical protein